MADDNNVLEPTDAGGQIPPIILDPTLGQLRPNGRINMETRLGRPIDNYQVRELARFEINQFANYRAEKWPNVKFLAKPSPEYDCHGLTFASRRTCIDRTDVIELILRDDLLQRVEFRHVEVGDIALYIRTEKGKRSIDHSGQVVEVINGLIPGIWVLSKWGKFKEARHPYNYSPYPETTVEFYRVNHEY